MTTLSVGQYSRFARVRRDLNLYAFCPLLDGQRGVLEGILEVEYTLHPSFPDPVRREQNANQCFALESEAWGNFRSYALVYWKDGRQESVEYRLNLEERGWPMGERIVHFKSGPEELVCNSLFDIGVEWRKLSTIARKSLMSEGDSEQILNELAARKGVRKAYFQSIDKETFGGQHRSWGYSLSLADEPFCLSASFAMSVRGHRGDTGDRCRVAGNGVVLDRIERRPGAYCPSISMTYA